VIALDAPEWFEHDGLKEANEKPRWRDQPTGWGFQYTLASVDRN
jgi:hypothetical protein